MFYESNYDIFYLNSVFDAQNGEHFTKAYSYDDLINIFSKSTPPTNDKINEEILRYTTFFFSQNSSTNISVDDVNTIIEKYNIDICFYLGDAFVFHTNIGKQINVPNYYWFPCHYYPFSKEDYDGLKPFSNILCLSPSIKLVLEKEFPQKQIYYLPHITETIEIKETKQEIRKKWTIPNNKYIVLIVARLNEIVNRKAIDVHLIAFKKFNDKYPNSFLFLQSIVHASDKYTFPINELADELKLTADNFLWQKNVFQEEHLIELYRLSDVLLSCSKAEGFGIPILEAQQYKLDVITSNFLSMAEHNFQNNVAEISCEIRHWGLNGNWTLPSSENIANKLEEVYLAKQYESNKPIVKKAKWIVDELTSFNNVKKNIFKIMNL